MRGTPFKERFENNVDENSNLYVISATDGESILYKIGYSEDMLTRMKSYFSRNPFTKIVEMKFIENCEEWERMLHSKFKASVGNEWYSEATFKKIKYYIDNPERLKEIKPPHKGVKKYKKKIKSVYEGMSETEKAQRLEVVRYNRSLSMKMLNEKTSKDNDMKILYVLDNWDFSINGKITLKKLADVSGISERTVYSRSKMLKEIIKQKNLGYKGKI